MKIVIVTDSFKGSLSAREACDAIARGVRRSVADAEIHCVPLGDGGEGTVDALVAAMPDSRTVQVDVTGPLTGRVMAAYGLLGPDGSTAVVEMATASGITLVPLEMLDPMRATTFGTGELLSHALSDPNVRHLIIGIGGSATNDGGSGALQALGVQFFDSDNMLITGPMNPAHLHNTARLVAPTGVGGESISVTVACDVANPLLGPTGASAVFGPQKGATPMLVDQLDSILAKFAPLLDDLCVQRGGLQSAQTIKDRPGAGAAGGLGAGLMAFFPDAVFKPGIDVVLEATNFERVNRWRRPDHHGRGQAGQSDSLRQGDPRRTEAH